MKKQFFLFFIGVMTLLTGCTQHSATRYFEKSSLYSSALQYTKKADILFENELKVMVNVTYLNAVDKQWEDEFQNFIVGIYVLDNAAQQNDNDLEDLSFFLSLNERNYVHINKLTKNHPMSGNLPLMNQWASYYVVQFDKEDEDKDLRLNLEHTTYGQTSLSFQLN